MPYPFVKGYGHTSTNFAHLVHGGFLEKCIAYWASLYIKNNKKKGGVGGIIRWATIREIVLHISQVS
jgi:hypothetical protein